MARSGRSVGLFLVTFMVLAGCSTDEPDLDVGAPCNANGDCTDPLVCILSQCHERCQNVASCPLETVADGTMVAERCVAVSGVTVCLRSDEESCAGDGGTCDEGLVCGADGLCRNDCAISRDCVPGQVCTDGVCVEEPSEETEDDAGAAGGDDGSTPEDSSGDAAPSDDGATAPGDDAGSTD
jgi:hypothetical protein